MKPKSDITRYMMMKNILRNILFRVDYKGVVNVSDFIFTIKDKLLEPYFNMDIYVIDQKYARI